MSIPKHEFEAQRLEALRHYGDLDAPYDPGLQELVEYASEACGVPISMVSMVEANRQSFRAEIGFGRSNTPLEQSFCAHAMLHGGVFEIPDATLDPRFQNNPLVTCDNGVRFYAGVAVDEPNGLPLGAICVVDLQPRTLTDFQRRTLLLLGKQAETRLDLLRAIHELREERGERVRAAAEREAALAQLDTERHRLKEMLEHSPAFASFLCGDDLHYEFVNATHRRLIGDRDLMGKPLREAFPELDEEIHALLRRVYETGEPYENPEICIEFRGPHDEAPTPHYLDVSYQPIRDTDGTILGVFSHGFDVTSHVRTRHALSARTIHGENVALMREAVA